MPTGPATRRWCRSDWGWTWVAKRVRIRGKLGDDADCASAEYTDCVLSVPPVWDIPSRRTGAGDTDVFFHQPNYSFLIKNVFQLVSGVRRPQAPIEGLR